MAATARRSHDLSSLRKCVSAGEALPAATRALWKAATGHRDHRRHRRHRDVPHLHLARRGARAAGRDRRRRARLPRAASWTTTASRCRRGTVGRLAVKGPTGCRYLADDRAAQLRARRLELHGRRLSAGRRRLLRLPGAHRRHDHQRRLQHRRARGRGRAAPASGGRRVRRGRRARRGARADRQGVRRAEARPRGRRGHDDGAAGLRQGRRSRRTSIRARSRSSRACRAPRPASCSASGCARRRRR